MPPKTPPPTNPDSLFDRATAATEVAPQRRAASSTEPKTARVSDQRDPEPTHGPGRAAGEGGDEATRRGLPDAAPPQDGNAIAKDETARAAGDAPSDPDGARADGERTTSSAPPQVTGAPPGQPTTAMQAQRTPVSFEPQNADEMWRYATMLAYSSLLPKAFYDKETGRARVADVHFVMLKGRALGLHPQVAIGNINVIDGKAEIGASLMVALCLRSGLAEYIDLVRSDERSATYVTKRVGSRRDVEFTYTIEEAQQMGLLDKGRTEWAKENNQWRKQPRTMLRRRCQSMLMREVYPDIVMGLYDHDELIELRERELGQGAPERPLVISGEARSALPEASASSLFARVADAGPPVPADPLKARLATRRSETTAAEVPTCSVCGSPRDPRDADPCIACRPDDPGYRESRP